MKCSSWQDQHILFWYQVVSFSHGNFAVLSSQKLDPLQAVTQSTNVSHRIIGTWATRGTARAAPNWPLGEDSIHCCAICGWMLAGCAGCWYGMGRTNRSQHDLTTVNMKYWVENQGSSLGESDLTKAQSKFNLHETWSLDKFGCWSFRYFWWWFFKSLRPVQMTHCPRKSTVAMPCLRCRRSCPGPSCGSGRTCGKTKCPWKVWMRTSGRWGHFGWVFLGWLFWSSESLWLGGFWCNHNQSSLLFPTRFTSDQYPRSFWKSAMDPNVYCSYCM